MMMMMMMMITIIVVIVIIIACDFYIASLWFTAACLGSCLATKMSQALSLDSNLTFSVPLVTSAFSTHHLCYQNYNAETYS